MHRFCLRIIILLEAKAKQSKDAKAKQSKDAKAKQRAKCQHSRSKFEQNLVSYNSSAYNEM